MPFIAQSFLHLRDLVLDDEGRHSFFVEVRSCCAAREACYQHPSNQKCEGDSAPPDPAREKHDFSLLLLTADPGDVSFIRTQPVGVLSLLKPTALLGHKHTRSLAVAILCRMAQSKHNLPSNQEFPIWNHSAHGGQMCAILNRFAESSWLYFPLYFVVFTVRQL